MKHRKTKCLIPIPITEDGKPCYRWRFNNEIQCGTTSEIQTYEHRVPFFLTLHAHVIIEQTLENITRKLLPIIFSKIILLFYDIIHGLVSSYNIKEISNFWLTERLWNNEHYG